jgi:hypothetical protein
MKKFKEMNSEVSHEILKCYLDSIYSELKRSLAEKGCKVSNVSLDLHEGLTFEEWKEIGIILGNCNRDVEDVKKLVARKLGACPDNRKSPNRGE